MRRCCANCEWNISPRDEESILEEQHYDEKSLDRPMAGDCVLGQIHDENFYCPEHKYCGNVERTYALYDDEYAGTGFLIVHMLDDEIDKFFKISSCMQSSLPHFLIYGCGKVSNDRLHKRFKTINFTIDKDNELFTVFNNLAQNLNNKNLYSFDGVLTKKDNLQFISQPDDVLINFNKDVFGVKQKSDYASINLVYNNSCEFYGLLSEFYNNLSKLSIDTSTDADIEELKSMQKRYYKF